jgi:hypothetical protein
MNVLRALGKRGTTRIAADYVGFSVRHQRCEPPTGNWWSNFRGQLQQSGR